MAPRSSSPANYKGELVGVARAPLLLAQAD